MSAKQATIAGFVAFINRQPATRSIDHARWNTCAVGHYAREELRVWRTKWKGRWVFPTIRTLFEQSGTCSLERYIQGAREGWKIPLTNKPTVMDTLDFAGQAHSYGQLRMVLAEKFPELGFGQVPPKVFLERPAPTSWVKKKIAELVS